MSHAVPKQTALFFGFLAAAMTGVSAQARPAPDSALTSLEARGDVAVGGSVSHHVADVARDPKSLQTLRRLGLAPES